MVRTSTALIFAVILSATGISGQDIPPSPNIRVQTRLVQIDVIVRDRNGPVENLSKDDFAVLDGRKPRQISIFSVHSSAPGQQSLPPLPPNTFSDLPQYTTTAPRSVTIVLLDNLNTLYGSAPESRFETQPYWLEDLALQNAKSHLMQFIEQLQPQDRVAIYGLRHSLHILCDFTSDRETLLRVISKYDPTSVTNRAVVEPGLRHGPVQDADGFENEAAALVAGSANEERAMETMAALEQIAAHVANIPGRKNLVWLTSNLPFSGEAMARILSPAQLAAYPIDARGLLARTTPSGPTEATYTLGEGPGVIADGAAPAQSSQPIGIANMESLANETGGQAFVNTNDIVSAIRKAVEDSEITYTLGFYIDRASIDGKFHELKVEVKRKGLALRYPKGYFAFEDAPATRNETEINLMTAIRSPIESSAIAVQVRLDRVERPLPHCLSISGSIDIHGLRLAQSGVVRSGAVGVVTVEQDESGKVIAQSASKISLRFRDKQYADYLKAGFPFHQYVQPKPGAVTLRILVQDANSAEVGSLIIPLSHLE